MCQALSKYLILVELTYLPHAMCKGSACGFAIMLASYQQVAGNTFSRPMWGVLGLAQAFTKQPGPLVVS